MVVVVAHTDGDIFVSHANDVFLRPRAMKKLEELLTDIPSLENTLREMLNDPQTNPEQSPQEQSPQEQSPQEQSPQEQNPQEQNPQEQNPQEQNPQEQNPQTNQEQSPEQSPQKQNQASDMNTETGSSLRRINWLCTNYSKRVGLILRQQKDQNIAACPLHEAYSSWLRKWRRSLFDPFRRKERIVISYNGWEATTTVAQVNFALFAKRHGVLEYARTHTREIAHDMATASKNRTRRKRKRNGREVSSTNGKREKLTVPPKTECYVVGEAVVHFK